MHTMAMLNSAGHITIGWAPENDAWVIPMIQKKMDEGCTFWIRGKRKTVQIKTTADIGALREVVVDDEDAKALLTKKYVELVADDEDDIVTLGRAKTAEEVAKTDTIMVAPKKGG